ncbi:MAG: acyl-CoA thioesterase, partial [Ensifer adhaerens]
MYRTKRPLRFGDCDPSGIAYFPSYLNILVGVT